MQNNGVLRVGVNILVKISTCFEFRIDVNVGRPQFSCNVSVLNYIIRSILIWCFHYIFLNVVTNHNLLILSH